MNSVVTMTTKNLHLQFNDRSMIRKSKNKKSKKKIHNPFVIQ